MGIVRNAVNTKYFISFRELARTPTENQPRQAPLINNLNMQAAERKFLSILFLSLGSAGRKNLMNEFSYIVVAMATLRENQNCERTFVKLRNQTLSRYNFFSRKQQQNETLRKFWNVLTGLAAKCQFREQTISLILDEFLQNMNNKTVQQLRCTELKDKSEEALRFAVAFEDGISQD